MDQTGQIPGGLPLPAGGNPLGRAAGTTDVKGNTVIELTPGSFPRLPRNVDVKFSQPHDVAGSYIDWMKQQYRDFCRGMNITYEQGTGDYEGVTYSSIRAGLLEFRRLITQIVAETIVFQFCRPWVAAWLDKAVLSGAIRIPNYRRDRRKYLRIDWMPDGWDWVNPVDDIEAEERAVRGGFKSRTRSIAERYGADAERVEKEIAQENARADESGLVFDSDPRKTQRSGQIQQTYTKEEK